MKEGSALSSVAFSPDGKTIAAGYDDGSWPAPEWCYGTWSPEPLSDDSLPVKEGGVPGVAFSPDGKTIAAGYKATKLWRRGAYGTWPPSRLSDKPLPRQGGPIAWKRPSAPTARPSWPDTTAAVAAAWCCGTRPGRRSPRPPPRQRKLRHGVAFSPDGKAVALAYVARRLSDAAGGVVLWDVLPMQAPLGDPLPVNRRAASWRAFSPTARPSRPSSTRGGVVLWDVAATRARVAKDPLPVEEGSVIGVAFSPDGKTLAAEYQAGGFSRSAASCCGMWPVECVAKTPLSP